MNSKVIFSASQQQWLMLLLNERLSVYQRDKPTSKVLTSCISALDKISLNATVFLNSWEKINCCSCVNENLPALYKQVQLPDALSLLNTSKEQKQLLHYIDMARDILAKCEPKSRRTFFRQDEGISFKQRLIALDKLKASDLVYISKSNEDHVYKIGFVYQGVEASIYELSNTVQPCDLEFYKLNANAVQYGKRYFSQVTDRKGALEALRSCKEDNYPTNQLTFFRQLLN